MNFYSLLNNNIEIQNDVEILGTNSIPISNIRELFPSLKFIIEIIPDSYMYVCVSVLNFKQSRA